MDTQEIDLVDLTKNENSSAKKKYYLVILWDKKPFYLLQVILADNSQDIVEKLSPKENKDDDPNNSPLDCVVNCCREEIFRAVINDNLMPVHYFDHKWHGFYVCSFECFSNEIFVNTNYYLDYIYKYYNEPEFEFEETRFTFKKIN